MHMVAFLVSVEMPWLALGGPRVTCTWWLLWLSVEMHWVHGPILALFAQNRLRKHCSQLVGSSFLTVLALNGCLLAENAD